MKTKMLRAFRTFRSLRALTGEVRRIADELVLIRKMMQQAQMVEPRKGALFSFYEGEGDPSDTAVMYVNDLASFEEEAFLREKEEEIGRELSPAEIQQLLNRRRES